MSAVQKAKDTLLRALDQLGAAERDLDAPPDRVDLIVVYSIGREDPDDAGAYHEVGGWSSTAGPKWMHAAMLRRAAQSFDDAAVAYDDPPDDEEED
ncbi:MAG TPA: hypothetical protein VN213_13630 [Solirubrobacteraceae bacterium]|nr:hypothetical protein [Solirubrobacteraceae bacterium]